jgi:hypothetical protein
MLKSLLKKKDVHDDLDHQPRPARRQDRYRRQMHDLTKRMVEQNDEIINLLKEILNK